VGKSVLMSMTSSPRKATTEGPQTSGRQTRAASAPAVPSVGRLDWADSFMGGDLVKNLTGHMERASIRFFNRAQVAWGGVALLHLG
jgi:hypothetical protein